RDTRDGESFVPISAREELCLRCTHGHKGGMALRLLCDLRRLMKQFVRCTGVPHKRVERSNVIQYARHFVWKVEFFKNTQALAVVFERGIELSRLMHSAREPCVQCSERAAPLNLRRHLQGSFIYGQRLLWFMES